jgi:endonuclease YncB( thermonuclease family)
MVTGRVSVLDGHTLWFPAYAIKVRLAGIDGCDLSQWAFDPVRHGESSELKPLPCGALAKAWLQRTVGVQRVTCRVSSKTEPGTLVGACMAGGRDLAIEMLRVGWARAKGPSPFHSRYLAWQRHAMSARYGMWASYVLDRDEWRRKAVDTTTSRLPIADFNLLAERESEISPSFEDARKRPRRTDR